MVNSYIRFFIIIKIVNSCLLVNAQVAEFDMHDRLSTHTSTTPYTTAYRNNGLENLEMISDIRVSGGGGKPSQIDYYRKPTRGMLHFQSDTRNYFPNLHNLKMQAPKLTNSYSDLLKKYFYWHKLNAKHNASLGVIERIQKVYSHSNNFKINSKSEVVVKKTTDSNLISPNQKEKILLIILSNISNSKRTLLKPVRQERCKIQDLIKASRP